jgi:hypothetical protein
MITIWTLIIMLVVAFANAYVAIIGVRRRVREGMRLWADDEGYYIPGYLGHMGFYRGFFINIGFAGTSLGVAGISLPGDSSVLGREAIIVLSVVNFIYGAVVACIIPADFEQVLRPFQGRFWRVALSGIAGFVIYGLTGGLLCWYAANLPHR